MFKKLFKLFLGSFIILGITFSFANANEGNAMKGQKIYLKFFKKNMDMNGGEFAKLQTIEEWKNSLLSKETFIQWVKENNHNKEKIVDFLKSDRFDRYMPHVKAFLIEYASDSGNVPSC